MLNFKMLESSAIVSVDGTQYSLSSADVDHAYWHMCHLVENLIEGPTNIKLGMQRVTLEENDWLDLMDGTEAFIRRTMNAWELSHQTIK